MDRVSSRHEGTLDGRLAPLDSGRPVRVSVVVPPEVAALASVQHSVWMSINMLARLDRVVDSISISCPTDVNIVTRISPLMAGATDLAAGIAVAAAAIDTVPVAFHDDPADVELIIGPGEATNGAIRVYGEGWCGGITRSGAIAAAEPSSLPFGPYIAAAIGVGEIFREVRIDPKRYPSADAAFYSLWSHEAATAYIPGGPATVLGATFSETLAGVGAVGCICAQTLWAAVGLSGEVLLVDGDPDGIDLTNLNRYLLFGRQHLNCPKASTARDLLAGSDIRWTAHDGPLETAAGLHRRILCATDTNESRLAVQTRWPESLLMASTHELRAELVRCDPRQSGPCARCHNDPATVTPDEELRRRFRQASPEEQSDIASRFGADLGEAVAWAETGQCGTTGERVRDALRTPNTIASAFAVPFVSLAAGTMLAAEAVKEHLDAATPLTISQQHASLQFWSPAGSRGASRYSRDPGCPLCRPESEAVSIWWDRVATHTPRRTVD
jgi:hypothetical protein